MKVTVAYPTGDFVILLTKAEVTDLLAPSLTLLDGAVKDQRLCDTLRTQIEAIRTPSSKGDPLAR